ncbi:MAG: hypothetical protein M3N08_06845 [Pseudomonadota bacterium]|nr:hypothetical protein [Pseudomonadota bacterium]
MADTETPAELAIHSPGPAQKAADHVDASLRRAARRVLKTMPYFADLIDAGLHKVTKVTGKITHQAPSAKTPDPSGP